MGFWSTLGKIGGAVAGIAAAPLTGGASLIPMIAGAAGSALSGASQASASNRGSQLDAATQAELINQARQRDYRDAVLAREQDRRASGNDAWLNLQRAAYVGNRQAYRPRNARLPVIGAMTPEERAAAQAFMQEQQARLAARDSLLPAVNDPGKFAYDPKLLKGGKFERIAGAIGGGLSAVGAVADQRRADADQRIIDEAVARLLGK